MEVTDTQFISLQKGKLSVKGKNFPTLNLLRSDQYDQTLDFKITAAVIANCDLVISSDSSIVHLAGGMNIKTITALSYVPEWRWLKDGDNQSGMRT